MFRSIEVRCQPPRMLLVAVTLLALFGPASASPAQTVIISGRVVGGSGRHPIHVALWNADGFLKKPVAELRLVPSGDRQFRFPVSPGRWAVSSYEDVNENGILDNGLFGPKEPHGFFPAFTGWHRPGFDEVAFRVDHDIEGANIVLK